MRKQFFAFIFFLLIGFGGIQSVFAEPCADDPRLASALRDLARGAAKISPPLTIKPETWLDMAEEFRALLGGNAKICPNIPVLKGGKPLHKPELDFATMWSAIRSAAIREDRDKVHWIFSNFIAKPMPAAEIIKTLEITDMPAKNHALLCDIAGLPDNSNTLIIDFYNAFGGRPSDKTKLLSGKAIRPDTFYDYPCENYNDWVTVEELKMSVRGNFRPNILWEKLDAIGLEEKK